MESHAGEIKEEGMGPESASDAHESHALTRRTLLQRAAGLGLAASTLGALDLLALAPARAPAATLTLPEIQYQNEAHFAPAATVEGVRVRYAPLYTTYATFTLARTPTAADQTQLARALAQIEASYPFTHSGLFMTIAYGVPYFERLPGGVAGTLVSTHIPHLLSDPQRLAFEEAQPSPTDVSPVNPEVSKVRFQVPVRIEENDVALILRSDSTTNIDEALAWLLGEGATLAGVRAGEAGLGGLLQITSRRLMFTQPGLPRKMAEAQNLPYAEMINPKSPMWMGFASQQVEGSGPPSITTFMGNGTENLTNARAGGYFAHGSVMHLSHVILDLTQFYARPKETYTRRVSSMFSSNPPPRPANLDPYTNGGGPGFVPDTFQSTSQAEQEASGANTFDGQGHIGHTTALQRSSRAYNRVPMHIRADGPGFDAMDVPDGSMQPKVQFAIFVPTAAFFAALRRNQASPDLVAKYSVPAENVGIERFMTTTRRQNFLVPPRRRRAFPLVELA